MKEKAKIHKEHRNRTVHHISKRLVSQMIGEEESKQDNHRQEKRKNIGGGQHQIIDVRQKDSKMDLSK